MDYVLYSGHSAYIYMGIKRRLSYERFNDDVNPSSNMLMYYYGDHRIDVHVLVGS